MADLPPQAVVALAAGEEPEFRAGDRVLIADHTPIGHYRVPTYLRGKRARVESVIEPAGVDNEEEAFGRNAGRKRHYYRVTVPMIDLWKDYQGSPRDELRIEVFENWLEAI